MLALLLQTIASIEAVGSPQLPLLTEKHVQKFQRPPPKSKKSIPRKKTRKWKGVYEHKDTPLHHH